jgi:hypothetical protein
LNSIGTGLGSSRTDSEEQPDDEEDDDKDEDDAESLELHEDSDAACETTVSAAWIS